MINAAHVSSSVPAWEGFPVVEPLRARHAAETLAFLAERPLHTVAMAGFIRENGIQSPLNRGSFYGSRNALGRLEGVALVGHATLFEARTDAALCALARQARDCASKYMIMGEREGVERFWNYYAAGSEAPRLVCHTVLMAQNLPAQDFGNAPDLRPAAPCDLEAVVTANVSIILKEHGRNPLEHDAKGFLRRCSLRIERGRTWVWTENERLLFKADVLAETPAATYIEGIYVSPEEKGRGYGRRGMSELARKLEGQTKAVCGLVAGKNTMARAFYEMMGYRAAADHATYFLEPEAN
ncbi:MAG TPA: GNAT family N-acetyltransferase [Pyrinomonadaceae bacterium]|nr:GNAT family N-acetyltransferase [Pyrinomonadaceae bacterium]